MKKHIILIMILFFVVSFYVINVYFKEHMKYIDFPKEAHNNTIAQAPIFEGLDDGKVYFSNENPWFCDETQAIFTCMLRPGQTHNEAFRIRDNNLLDSCEEGLLAKQKDIEICFENCSLYQTDINICIEMCEQYNRRLPPECEVN